ncbi:MAG: hypothetical protein JWQ76_2998 [Ramlibacter sp.]|nr:hypothetical protein [Ramlibacter sp.]
MLPIDVIAASAHAGLGDAWVRYQSARIQQRHLQVGRHFRVDLNGLLRRLAIAHRAQVDDRICADWIAPLADFAEVVVSDFRGAPSQVDTEKAAAVVQSLGYLEPRALQLLVPFTREAGSWRLVTLDFGAEARRHDCEFLMCFAFQTPDSQLSVTSPYAEIGVALLRSEVSEPLFILTVKSACGLFA